MTQQELEKRLREAELIRSSRKTLAIEVRPDGRIRIRAPRFCPSAEIRRFVRKNRNWIVQKLDQTERRRRAADAAGVRPFTREELRELARQAKDVLPQRVHRYAQQMGVSCGQITIRAQRTRWGSCSSRGNLNFNCLLMLTPREVQDYVIVHELAHRKEMNHSPHFWAIVEGVLPEYRAYRRWLQKEGQRLIERRLQMQEP